MGGINGFSSVEDYENSGQANFDNYITTLHRNMVDQGAEITPEFHNIAMASSSRLNQYWSIIYPNYNVSNDAQDPKNYEEAMKKMQGVDSNLLALQAREQELKSVDATLGGTSTAAQGSFRESIANNQMFKFAAELLSPSKSPAESFLLSPTLTWAKPVVRLFIGETPVDSSSISVSDSTKGTFAGLFGYQNGYYDKSDEYKFSYNRLNNSLNNATRMVADALGKVEATKPPILPGGGSLAPGMALAGGSVPLTPKIVAPVTPAVPTLYSSAGNSKSGNTKSSETNNTDRNSNMQKQESPVWKEFGSVKGRDRKTSGTGKNQQFYEWDYTHNDIEVYDSKGKHIGSMDPVTGLIYKPAVQGRRIDI